ncbi:MULTISPECIES: DUF1430 domain-containing protein [Bacillus]|uniref:DUF1430 domain-containing protein n=1 Tax=Bacillus TaxID=1386 RepID=UPI001CDCA546|nr:MULTISPECIES: DUF1430 domain-containing protein [Bacillus]MCY7949796.1 DUF1430 domain-containing protein [Bacillus inaquosorum]MCY9099744.1 DUF1430 domain-containing protein [Bacillus inaquosorum]MCY9308637.1 DUF1430 domain-containing protein [Bacillus inaquosorum]MEC0518381.1 DUF1430 domain-containing protein [Bacillus inaquosorum]MEC0606852.1 DUF1430 domain-containing protein [Bacillus inaquosorum]
MKKLLFLLVITTFIVVSFLSIKQFEFLQFQSFNHDNVDDAWNVVIDEGNTKISKNDNFKMLEQIAFEAKVNLQRISYENNSNNKDKMVYYVVLYNASEYFKDLKLKSGKFLQSNSSSNDFLSTVQTKNKHQIGQLEIFHSFEPIEIRPMIAAEKRKDIKGTYTLIGEKQAENFKKIALQHGFSIKLSKNENSQSVSTSYPYQEMMYIGLLILCLLIMLTILYDLSNNYKEIAVRYMFGCNLLDIGLYLLKRYIPILISSLLVGSLGLILYLYWYNHYQQFIEFLYFLSKNIALLSIILTIILLIVWFSTGSINIPQMIKNKKPVRMFFYLNIIVRFVLAVFLLLGLEQGISKFQVLKSTVSNQEKWSLLKNYSYLGMIASPEQKQETLNFQKDKEKRKKIHLLYEKLESQGAFYIYPSDYYSNDSQISSQDINPWGEEGRKVEINKNYLSVNVIKDIYGKDVEIPPSNKGEINVLVPIKYKMYKEDIEKSIAEDYKGIYDIKTAAPVKVNIIYVQNNQSYFTYSTNSAQNSNYKIVDPIAVIVNNKFDPLILANNISMGYGFYTKISEGKDPFKIIKRTLEEYELNNIWNPVSIAYSNVELKIANDKEALQLMTIYCGVFLLLAVVLLIFSAVYYLEMNKKLLSIQWIFGYSFFEKHSLIYLSVLVFWSLTFMVSFFVSGNIALLGEIALGLAILDIVLTSILLIMKEYNITKQVLNKE